MPFDAGPRWAVSGGACLAVLSGVWRRVPGGTERCRAALSGSARCCVALGSHRLAAGPRYKVSCHSLGTARGTGHPQDLPERIPFSN